MVIIETILLKDLAKKEWEITYGIHSTPFGWCVIGVTDKKICQFAFIKSNTKKEALKKISLLWPNARPTKDDSATKIYLSFHIVKQLKLILGNFFYNGKSAVSI